MPSSTGSHFRPASTWTPSPNRNPVLQTFIKLVLRDALPAPIQKPPPRFHNFPTEQRLALEPLTINEDLVIEPCDKGGGIAIMNRVDYIAECMRQLNNTTHYSPQTIDLTPRHRIEIDKLLLKGLHTGEINNKEYSVLTPKDTRTPNFYIMPKVHKQGNPGRPILSANSSPTEMISAFVDHHNNTLVRNILSYIRDTVDFFSFISNFPPLPPEALLCTLDVSSLYTNISPDEGIQALRQALDTRPAPQKPSTNFLADIAELILTKNNFQFNNHHYLQIQGTPMGSKMAPSYANLFMDNLERKFLSSTTHQPLTWKRYIDDIFVIWTHGTDAWDSFVTNLNGFHPTIKFTESHRSLCLPFLDVRVTIDKGSLHTDVYCKPTDCHPYLRTDSAHPKALIDNIPYGQFFRLKRICSNKVRFDTCCQEFKHLFLKRGYKADLLDKSIQKASQCSRESLLKPKPKAVNTNLRISFIMEYNPSNPQIKQIIQKHWHVLSALPALNHILDHPPIFALSRGEVSEVLRAKRQPNMPLLCISLIWAAKPQ
ncbi:PREDICTED: uncharacterized protein LOC106811578 [Priapulus caudatus]|uniref:Uncharacterized protein LOC106811578 n=1 Tax=Priapulus caudatus TaxID=37621 RepID=A0ABM1EEX0_PRICU|nr:PREDICTED: uncharacterized protein LOC106811578 [Priapulus caudatus]